MNEQLKNEGDATRAIALQEAVFSPPNTIRASSFDALEAAMRWHRQGHSDRPVLLPFKFLGDDLIVWYACAPAGAMFRVLVQELGAFLGPSYVQIAPADRTPDLADSHMLSPIVAAGWQAVRFVGENTQAEKPVLQQWLRLWRLWLRRPVAASQVPKSFDQVRSEFDRALAAKNESGAYTALATLRERFGLSAENRLYMDIRLSAAFRRWEEIARHRLLHTIIHLQLPPETYGDVVEAIYEADVAPFERAGRLEDLLDRFRETMAETAKPLFRTRRTSGRTTALKAFALYELIQDRPRADLCTDLLTNLGVGAFGELDVAIRLRVAQLEIGSDYRDALLAIEREQFDRAYGLLWPLASDVPVLVSLVLCARESDDSAKAAAVLNRLAALPMEVRAAVEQNAPVRLERLRVLAGEGRRTASTLGEQFEQFADESADKYVERWRELARSTPPHVVLQDPEAPNAAVECLTRLVINRPDLFERLHPLWHELFVERMEPNRLLIPVYVALLETLRARGDFGDSDRGLLRQTLCSLVTAGPDGDTYRFAVDEMQEIFKEVRSPYVMTWALDVCDTLAVAPVRDPDARMRFLLSVLQAGVEYEARLSPAERGLLKLLVHEAGLEVPSILGVTNRSIVDPPDSPHRVRLVAFYSLDEAATKRAIHVLAELFPHLKIESSADIVCTQRLKLLAHQADLFVFAWKSSKHAAFDCVKASVRGKGVLVMASGAGTTSLVGAAVQNLS